jgi:hypothetical protein
MTLLPSTCCLHHGNSALHTVSYLPCCSTTIAKKKEEKMN